MWKLELEKYNSCKNNIDYLNHYHKNIIQKHYNESMIESKNQYKELVEMYKNKLIAFRPGCVESSFFLFYKYKFLIKQDHLKYDKEIDYFMKHNAGLYYKNSPNKVWNWWVEQFEQIMKNSVLCSCYCFLHYDLPVCAKINKTGLFYNYSQLSKVILKNSENKKILYVGYNTDSIKTGYERIHKVWKFKVSNFIMHYVKTPQTTFGMEYPHENMIETTESILKEIETYDFDTAIFSCGAYGPPLMNRLKHKNLIYLGSDCLKMFGIKINLQPWELYEPDVNKEYIIDVVESLPSGCKNHPEKKYWKIE